MAQRKTNIRYINKTDLDDYVQKAYSIMQTDENGNKFFILEDVDSKLDISLWTPNQIWLEQEISELLKKFEELKEPTAKELEELGKEMSEYYGTKERIERLKKEYNGYN